ncbi:MAG: hypothetical protein E6182_09955 [Clostridioides difficile]|nr:hypothetical protein [Clostridioides difficile]
MSSYNIEEVIRRAKNAVWDSANKIEKETKKTISEEVDSTVYSYKPKHKVIRRKKSGGLADESNIVTTSKRKGIGLEMEVENKATGRNGFSGLTEVTEYGTAANWNGTPPARPFMEKSAKKLENKLAKTLKEQLRKQGFKVK